MSFDSYRSLVSADLGPFGFGRRCATAVKKRSAAAGSTPSAVVQRKVQESSSSVDVYFTPETPLVVCFIIDHPTAWAIGWNQSPEAMKATLRTKAGLMKVHKQFYHVSLQELLRIVLPLFPISEHAEIRKLASQVCNSCDV